MELRELRAFVAAGRELHFARAAESLCMSPSAMSELIRRLELELGAPLFTRTTRRVALTDAGIELLGRAEVMLDLAAQAGEAVGAIARGAAGTIRLGITPPAAPVIAPHLAHCFTESAPGLAVDIQRMWQPDLAAALRDGTVDLAVTCAALGADDPRIISAEIGRDQLLIGLRADDPMAGEEDIDLPRLADRTLGLHPAHLFPAWHAAQRHALAEAAITPPTRELDDTDLTARRWTNQRDVEWIMLIGSLVGDQQDTRVYPAGARVVPFTMSWLADATQRPVVQRFINATVGAELPSGWLAPRA